jgi:hypothetical protein
MNLEWSYELWDMNKFTLLIPVNKLGVPQAAQGSGYTLQVLAALWALRSYRSSEKQGSICYY